MKTIAFYLPQFHSIPLNDKYWGEGFTEWINVKKSSPLFKGHVQPEIPLNNDYYNLTDVNVQIRQAEMAKKYGLDGFCYYHYWFSGELLLEKPMENMLNEPKVDIPFCCCWANEHWSKNWDGQPNKVIMQQNYSESTSDWKQHYDYLSPFFHDKRYIKHDNKPVFIIYKPYLMENCSKMLEFWNKLAIEDGFSGVYFGYQYPESFKHDKKGFDFGIEFEPLYTRYFFDMNNEYRKPRKEKILHSLTDWRYGIKWVKRLLCYRYNKLLGKPNIYDYDAIWEEIINRSIIQNIMPGAFPGWDNSPRRGGNATVYFESTPEKFEKYMTALVKKARENNCEFLFINAWNEWGEGAHLEPDEYHKYGYLEGLKKALEQD